jgi:DNA-binding response OmpR family regulator
MNEHSIHLLIVDDDPDIRDLLAHYLQSYGMQCLCVGNGQAMRDALAHTSFDLIILDLMLPGADGIAVCRAVRRGGPNQDVPILMLTARREESDKVLGLESGADDYLAKPFGIRELVARARALLRRPRRSQLQAAAASAAEAPIQIHGLQIDPARRRVRANGHDVDLTAQEFRLLHLLATHPGIVFSREALLTRV